MKSGIEIACKVFNGQQLLTTIKLHRTTELGRRAANEPQPYTRLLNGETERIIIAELAETNVSRKHLLIEIVAPDKLGLTNLSAKSPILFAQGISLAPGERQEFQLPVALELGSKIIRLEAKPHEELPLQSLLQPTMVPGSQRPPKFPDLLVNSDLSKTTIPEEELLNWLQATMEVFQSASNSVEFFPKATQAAARLIRLDIVGVMLYQAEKWVVASTSSQDQDEDSEWQPSQTMLQRVQNDKRTFYHVPGLLTNQAQSLIGVQSLVAAPILNSRAEIVGALYGQRRSGGRYTRFGPLQEFEVKLFELLASGVATGLARLEQEQKLIAERVRFEQFFTPELTQVLEAQGEQMLAPREAEITVLFCDIKGFSRISANNGAVVAVEWVRDVLSALSDAVAEFQGVLIDYSGDALEAIWGAPLTIENHAAAACAAAAKMQACLPEINDRWQTRLGEATDVAIGINTGLAQVGNIGSRRKFKYGAFGTTVNLASRVQGATKHVGISFLATQTTVALLPTTISRRKLCTVRTVNIDLPTTLYEIQMQPTAEWNRLQCEYELALSQFEQNQIELAKQRLWELANQYPRDLPIQKLLQRIKYYQADPMQPFDAVWSFDSK